jgi:hypothetical protein
MTLLPLIPAKFDFRPDALSTGASKICLFVINAEKGLPIQTKTPVRSMTTSVLTAVAVMLKKTGY